MAYKGDRIAKSLAKVMKELEDAPLDFAKRITEFVHGANTHIQAAAIVISGPTLPAEQYKAIHMMLLEIAERALASTLDELVMVLRKERERVDAERRVTEWYEITMGLTEKLIDISQIAEKAVGACHYLPDAGAHASKDDRESCAMFRSCLPCRLAIHVVDLGTPEEFMAKCEKKARGTSKE
jgi:hypothetical protein